MMLKKVGSAGSANSVDSGDDWHLIWLINWHLRTCAVLFRLGPRIRNSHFQMSLILTLPLSNLFFWGGVLLSLPFFRSVQVSFSDLTFRWQPWFWCGVCISLLLYNVGIHCWHWWLTGHLTWLLLKEGLLFGNPSSRFWRKNVVLWSPLQFNLIPRKMVSDGSRSTSLHQRKIAFWRKNSTRCAIGLCLTFCRGHPCRGSLVVKHFCWLICLKLVKG